ncbi:Fanconi anemia group J protein [Dissophora globulifera]|uniref:DNA 5'-3' helicase n=1 Tax=Dissophora globulifera TaxID=979702 RepID=A0A9P6RV76_9FUNG|nr:Fanconi anemia group J protein [Dissophora globulifera]
MSQSNRRDKGKGKARVLPETLVRAVEQEERENRATATRGGKTRGKAKGKGGQADDTSLQQSRIILNVDDTSEDSDGSSGTVGRPSASTSKAGSNDEDDDDDFVQTQHGSIRKRTKTKGRASSNTRNSVRTNTSTIINTSNNIISNNDNNDNNNSDTERKSKKHSVLSKASAIPAAPIEFTTHGVKIKFPFTPYKSQKDMMSRIVEALQKKENALLESPTGSGKSLALLCGALAWLDSEKERRQRLSRKRAMQRAEELKLEKDEIIESPYFANQNAEASGAVPTTTSTSTNLTGCGSCEGSCGVARADTNSASSAQRARQAGDATGKDNDDFQPSIASAVPGESKKAPLDIQYDDEERTKSPTDYKGAKGTKDKDGVASDSVFQGYASLPKIYFGTRTHKQITQLIKELKSNTVYRPRLESVVNKNDACQDLLDDDLCHMRHRANKLAESFGGDYSSDGSNIWDMEDLISEGKEMRACPYFAARTLAANAELVFCPYSYLIDPQIRKAMEINLDSSIVILDEAHNIEDASRDAGGFEAVDNDLKTAYLQFKNMAEHNVLTDPCLKLRNLATMFLNILENQTTFSVNNYEESTEIWTSQETLEALEKFGLNRHTILDYDRACQTVSKAQKERKEWKKERKRLEQEKKFSDEYLQDEDKKRPNVIVSPKVLRAMEGLIIMISRLLDPDLGCLDDYKIAIVESVDRSTGEEQAFEYNGDEDDSNRKRKRSSTKSKAGKQSAGGYRKKKEFKFWCFNPGVIFRPLSMQARSVILTSGTLSPMDSFASELQTTFTIQLEADHVVDKSQVWTGVLPYGPTKVKMDGKYNSAGSFPFQDELGRVVERICETTPHGVLCFVSSYKLMENLMTRWQNTGQYQRLSAIKKVILEPRQATTKIFDKTLKSFYDHISQEVKNGTDGGALLFAVFRGKCSEGIDFTDSNCRAVLSVSIPFPSTSDLKIKLKKDYNDQQRQKFRLQNHARLHNSDQANLQHLNHSIGTSSAGNLQQTTALAVTQQHLQQTRFLLSGQRWYEIQAYRAYNQAIGRCIRHRKDWGAMVLLDYRFAQPNTQQSLSKWVRPLVKSYKDFESGIQSLKEWITPLHRGTTNIGLLPDTGLTATALDSPNSTVTTIVVDPDVQDGGVGASTSGNSIKQPIDLIGEAATTDESKSSVSPQGWFIDTKGDVNDKNQDVSDVLKQLAGHKQEPLLAAPEPISVYTSHGGRSNDGNVKNEGGGGGDGDTGVEDDDNDAEDPWSDYPCDDYLSLEQFIDLYRQDRARRGSFARRSRPFRGSSGSARYDFEATNNTAESAVVCTARRSRPFRVSSGTTRHDFEARDTNAGITTNNIARGAIVCTARRSRPFRASSGTTRHDFETRNTAAAITDISTINSSSSSGMSPRTTLPSTTSTSISTSTSSSAQQPYDDTWTVDDFGNLVYKQENRKALHSTRTLPTVQETVPIDSGAGDSVDDEWGDDVWSSSLEADITAELDADDFGALDDYDINDMDDIDDTTTKNKAVTTAATETTNLLGLSHEAAPSTGVASRNLPSSTLPSTLATTLALGAGSGPIPTPSVRSSDAIPSAPIGNASSTSGSPSKLRTPTSARQVNTLAFGSPSRRSPSSRRSHPYTNQGPPSGPLSTPTKQRVLTDYNFTAPVSPLKRLGSGLTSPPSASRTLTADELQPPTSPSANRAAAVAVDRRSSLPAQQQPEQQPQPPLLTSPIVGDISVVDLISLSAQRSHNTSQAAQTPRAHTLQTPSPASAGHSTTSPMTLSGRSSETLHMSVATGPLLGRQPSSPTAAVAAAVGGGMSVVDLIKSSARRLQTPVPSAPTATSTQHQPATATTSGQTKRVICKTCSELLLLISEHPSIRYVSKSMAGELLLNRRRQAEAVTGISAQYNLSTASSSSARIPSLGRSTSNTAGATSGAVPPPVLKRSLSNPFLVKSEESSTASSVTHTPPAPQRPNLIVVRGSNVVEMIVDETKEGEEELHCVLRPLDGLFYRRIICPKCYSRSPAAIGGANLAAAASRVIPGWKGVMVMGRSNGGDQVTTAPASATGEESEEPGSIWLIPNEIRVI